MRLGMLCAARLGVARTFAPVCGLQEGALELDAGRLARPAVEGAPPGEGAVEVGSTEAYASPRAGAVVHRDDGHDATARGGEVGPAGGEVATKQSEGLLQLAPVASMRDALVPEPAYPKHTHKVVTQLDVTLQQGCVSRARELQIQNASGGPATPRAGTTRPCHGNTHTCECIPVHAAKPLCLQRRRRDSAQHAAAGEAHRVRTPCTRACFQSRLKSQHMISSCSCWGSSCNSACSRRSGPCIATARLARARAHEEHRRRPTKQHPRSSSKSSHLLPSLARARGSVLV